MSHSNVPPTRSWRVHWEEELRLSQWTDLDPWNVASALRVVHPVHIGYASGATHTMEVEIAAVDGVVVEVHVELVLVSRWMLHTY